MSLKRRKLDSGNACTTASAEPIPSNCSTPTEALSSPSTGVDEAPASTSSVDSKDIPAFALHSGGTYYVPVTVHSQALDESARQNVLAKAADVACHPVTISVNFSTSVAAKTEASTTAATPAHNGEKCASERCRQERHYSTALRKCRRRHMAAGEQELSQSTAYPRLIIPHTLCILYLISVTWHSKAPNTHQIACSLFILSFQSFHNVYSISNGA